MEATVSKRRKLDTNKVTFSGKTLSTSQALKDVIAMRWSADVVDGNSFRGEGATVKLAEDDGNLLKVFVANKQTAGFNPFD